MDNKEATHFIWIFLAVIGILVAIIIIWPYGSVPERSRYLSADQEQETLNQGKVILMFFYQPQSKLSEQQAQLVLDLDRTYEWLVVEWFNTKEELGDKRVMDEMRDRNITAIPYFVVKNKNQETSHLGILQRIELEDMVIGMKQT